MKKLIAFVIICLLSLSVATAESDLASMSFDELLELRNQLNAEIMSRPEWKEVVVDPGQWVVGIDIPAGIYSVHPTYRSANFVCYDENERLQINIVTTEAHPIGKVELKDGWIVKPNKAVVFAPPMSLGF